MARYGKLDVSVILNQDDVACVKCDDAVYVSNIRNVLNKRILDKNLHSAGELAIQGAFFTLKNVQIKSSHSVLYNWNIDDVLVKFCLKARLRILPTEYIKYMWNSENDPVCRLCKSKREYMSHVLNGCKELSNFYSRRHDRIVDKLAEELKQIIHPKSVYVNKMCETVFPHMREKLKEIVHRKPDIIVNKNGTYYIVEFTVCYDTYFEYAFDSKVNRYGRLSECLKSPVQWIFFQC